MLQVVLLVFLLAGLVGLLNAFWMLRLFDFKFLMAEGMVLV